MNGPNSAYGEYGWLQNMDALDNYRHPQRERPENCQDSPTCEFDVALVEPSNLFARYVESAGHRKIPKLFQYAKNSLG